MLRISGGLLKNTYLVTGIIIQTALLSLNFQCKRNNPEPSAKNSSITIKDGITDKGSYTNSSRVKFSCLVINDLQSSATIKNVTLEFRDISQSNMPVVFEKELKATITLAMGEQLTLQDTAAWTIPATAPATAYGIYLRYLSPGNTIKSSYLNFFRITKPGDMTTYDITSGTYQGLNIYSLQGGLSAECDVQKAIENLGHGLSHTWFVSSPGFGPDPVLATPPFLEKAVKKTVDLYNQVLGEHTPFETVVIGPGLEVMPYISKTLKAPYLPMHFLVSCNTVKEIQSVLDYSNAHGYSSYATLGYDGSVLPAVSWVKLLKLPEEYLGFLRQHGVKNIVVTGFTGDEGENTAKRIINNAGDRLYAPGSLFILYPGGGSPADVQALSSKIADFTTTSQQPGFIHIADWESGILQEQADSFIADARNRAGVLNSRFITSSAMISLWDLATYITGAYIHKNISAFTNNGQPAVSGVSLNPYFITHAGFENHIQYLPFIYWQMNPNDVTAERMKQVLQRTASVYFPQVQISGLDCWINSSQNCGGGTAASLLKQSLITKGFTHFTENDYREDEIWYPADGMKAPVEIRAQWLADHHITSSGLKQQDDLLQPLTLSDLDDLGLQFPEIRIR